MLQIDKNKINKEWSEARKWVLYLQFSFTLFLLWSGKYKSKYFHTQSRSMNSLSDTFRNIIDSTLQTKDQSTVYTL